MKNFWTYIVVLISLNNFLYSQEIVIDDYDVSLYPQIQLKTYFINSNIHSIPNESLIILKENDLEINDFSIDCSNVGNYTNQSYILSIDVSQSMSENGLDKAKIAAEQFITNALELNPDNEILIQLFSFEAFVLQDFSSDKNVLLEAISEIELFGYTDFNAAFYTSKSSSLNLFEYSSYPTSIITISDAKSIVDENEVITLANTNNIRVFPLILNTERNESFVRIAEQTAGRYKFSNDNNVIIRFIKQILLVSNEINPCTIEFISQDCEFIKNVSIDYDNFVGDNVNLYVEPTKFNYIDYTDNNYIEFSKENDIEEIEIKAVNDDIFIDNISNDDLHFQIINNVENYLLKKDSTLTLKVQYFNSSEDYIVTEFQIFSDVCYGKSFWCSNGDKNSILDKNLQVQFPNGGEVFQARNDSIVKWSGVSPGDTISVELSTNNGLSWSRIRNQVYAGLEGRIIFPDVNSDECLLRIKHLSSNKIDNRIHLLQKHENDILALKHSSDGNFLFSADIDGNIIKWNLNDYSFDNYILQNILGLNDFDINDTGSLIAYASSDPSIQFYNTNLDIIEFKLNSTESIIKKFIWNKSNNYVAGFSNNKLLIWDFPNAQPIKTLTIENENLTDMAFSDGKLIVSTFESNLYVINLTSLEIENTYDISNSAVNSIDFNSTGKNLVAGLNEKDIYIVNPFSNIQLKKYIDNNNPITKVKWSKQNNTIATVNSSNQVKLWSLTEPKEIYTYIYHNDIITAADWSPVNNFIATAEGNGEIHYWSVDNLPFENQPLQIDTSDDVFSIKQPKLELKNVSFKPLKIGNYQDTIITDFINNIGEIDIKIDSIALSGPLANSFIINSNIPKILNYDSLYNISLTFKPTQIGENRVDFLIYSGLKIFKTSLIGFANPKIAEQLVNEIDFGKVNLKMAKDTTISLFQNVSTVNISISNVELLNNNSQFEIIDFNSSVNNNENFNIDMSYTPENLSLTGELLKISYNAGETIYVSLKGKGVAPEILLSDSLIFADLRCNNIFADTLLTITNTGTNFLSVDSVKSIGSNAFTVNVLDDFIDVDQDLNIEILFEPSIKGDHIAEITLFTNYLTNDTNQITFEIYGYLDSIGLEFSKNTVEFENLNKNQIYYDSLVVSNTGTDTLFFDSQYQLDNFELDTEKQILLPEDNMKVFVTFLGASNDGQYREVFNYNDYCNNNHQIILNAIVGKSSAQIEVTNSIDLGETKCGNDKSNIFEISNTGLTDLIIYNMSLSNNYFRIDENTENVIIKTGEVKNFTIKSNVLQDNTNFAQLTIMSNAENSVSGETTISVSLFNNFTHLDFSTDTLYFRNALENIEYESYVIVNNTGTIPFNFDNEYETEYFSISEINSTKIGENKNSNIKILFKGGLAGEQYKDSFIFKDSCNNEYKLYLVADVIGYAQAGLRIGDFSVDIGDTLSMPIYLYSPENIDLPDVESYSVELTYNANLMYPINETPIGIVDNQLRTIILDEIPGNAEVNNPAITLDFLVTLGDTNFTELSLGNAYSPQDESISVETKDGTVIIEGICEEGGDRYIVYSGVVNLQQNRPNPADEKTTIEFTLIEKGNYTLDLYDINGHYLINIVNGFSDSAKKIETTLNLKKLSAGNYLYVLTTDSHKFVKKMTIKR